MHDYTVTLSLDDLKFAKKYIERRSADLPDFKDVFITSHGETKFEFKPNGLHFMFITISHPSYDSNKKDHKHLAPQTLDIQNTLLKKYADAQRQYEVEKSNARMIESIVNLLKQYPSQVEPTLQHLLSNVARAQTLQRGVSDSSVTPTMFANRR